ncbi:TetR family transcriptional regulator [Solimonas terrae]|uniref:TetR family transcriptional regulator n=1 Tax=Solimonas terrae TaxID=1396819 RepID=UPI0019D54CA4|nr:TetR family transcriptional regulator [Solimonas terrae]
MHEDERMPRNAGTRITRTEQVDATRRGGRPAVLSRERILDVARQIPARELTMPIVARRLDVSAAALYRHFDSRDALLAALGARLAETFEVRAADPAHWREWLLETNIALFRFLVDNPVILAVPDWSYVESMGNRLLDAAYSTLENAGFDTVAAIETWGVVSGHAYLGARLLHDAPAQKDAVAPRAAIAAQREDATGERARLLAFTRARGTSDSHELLVHSLRWLVSILPEPARRPAGATNGRRDGQRARRTRRVPGATA